MRKGYNAATKVQDCCKEIRKKTYSRSKCKDPKHEIKHDDLDIMTISKKHGLDWKHIKKILTDV